MPSWGDLIDELSGIQDPQAKGVWLGTKFNASVASVAARLDCNVLVYGSSWLQKPHAPAPSTIITHEDLNGFMSTIHKMDWTKKLVLILHTPGGVTNAAETIVHYLHAKFARIEVIIPTLAMSAGTMISLSASKIIMGKQSQLGPIDPQFVVKGMNVSAKGIIDQFSMARAEILKTPMAAHAWAPILQQYGASQLIDAKNALQYSERMVAGWLEKHMFAGQPRAKQLAAKAAKHFNDAASHKSHGRRIDRDEARSVNIVVENLEDHQELQDEALTVYHLMTIMFDMTPATKLIQSHHGRRWIKNFLIQPPGQPD